MQSTSNSLAAFLALNPAQRYQKDYDQALIDHLGNTLWAIVTTFKDFLYLYETPTTRGILLRASENQVGAIVYFLSQYAGNPRLLQRGVDAGISDNLDNPTMFYTHPLLTPEYEGGKDFEQVWAMLSDSLPIHNNYE